MDQTKVMDGTFVRILTWYDNEWGFSNRMNDTAVALGKLIGRFDAHWPHRHDHCFCRVSIFSVNARVP